MSDEQREVVQTAIGAVLFNVMNFPEKAQSRLLGQDMGPLRTKLTDAVMCALAAQPVTGTVEYMLRVPGEQPYGAVRATLAEVLEDKRYVKSRWGDRFEAVRRTVTDWEEVN